jgi:hypothetical protein
VLEHCAYSPNLAPNDLFLFPNIEEIWKERHLDDNDDIRSNITEALKAMPQNQIHNCFEGAGIGTQLPKGSTLKATTVVFSNEVCSTFTAMCSRTLLSDHVQLTGANDCFKARIRLR